jgi:hypothetical protein
MYMALGGEIALDELPATKEFYVLSPSRPIGGLKERRLKA